MSTKEEKAIIDAILSKGIINPHSGFDVELDDVLAYFDEAEEKGESFSVDGFLTWLKEE